MRFEYAYKQYEILGMRHLKKQSLETFCKNFNLHILPYFKDKDIFSLTKIDFLEWKNTIIDFNFSNSFNNSLYVCFNSFIQFCCDYYNLEYNYLKELGNFKRKIEEKKIDFYTLKEFKLFISNVDNIVYKSFFEFMFFVGTRPGETFALRFSDLENDIISIRHNLTSKGGRTLDTPKNQSSMRKIKLDRRMYKQLCKLKKYYTKKYNNECFDYYIFGGKNPLSPTTVNRYKKNACSKSNLRTITLHQFRHSNATLLISNGIMPNIVSKRLGHSKISTTLDIYVHSSLDKEKSVVTTLNSIRFKTFCKNFKSILKR